MDASTQAFTTAFACLTSECDPLSLAEADRRISLNEIQPMKSELQLTTEGKQASMMEGTREIMAEFMNNDGLSESSSAEGSTTVRGSL